MNETKTNEEVTSELIAEHYASKRREQVTYIAAVFHDRICNRSIVAMSKDMEGDEFCFICDEELQAFKAACRHLHQAFQATEG